MLNKIPKAVKFAGFALIAVLLSGAGLLALKWINTANPHTVHPLLGSPTIQGTLPDYIPQHIFNSGTKITTITKQDGSIITNVTQGSTRINSTEGIAYVEITLEGDEKMLSNVEKTQQGPKHFVVVLDISGSMQGEKLKYAKEAIVTLTNMIGSNDSIDLITYGSSVYEPYISKGEYNQQTLLQEIEKISSMGGTYLEGGLKKGLNIANKINSDTYTRVILLSDGMANEGLSDAESLAAMVTEINNSSTVSTIGIGIGYNEKIMTQVAIAGDGSYYFLEDPTHASNIFEQEFDAVSKVVAENITLTIDVSNSFAISNGFGAQIYKAKYLQPNDVRAGFPYNYIIELELDKSSRVAGKKVTLEIELEYLDATTNKTVTSKIPVTFTVTNQNVNPLEDDNVFTLYMNTLDALGLSEMYSHLDQWENEDAEEVLNTSLSLLKNANKRLSGKFDTNIKQVEEQLQYVTSLGKEYVNDSADGNLFQKENSGIMFDRLYNK